MVFCIKSNARDMAGKSGDPSGYNLLRTLSHPSSVSRSVVRYLYCGRLPVSEAAPVVLNVSFLTALFKKLE